VRPLLVVEGEVPPQQAVGRPRHNKRSGDPATASDPATARVRSPERDVLPRRLTPCLIWRRQKKKPVFSKKTGFGLESRLTRLQQLADRLAVVEDVHRPAAAVQEGHRRVDAEGLVQRGQQLRSGVTPVLGVLAAGAGRADGLAHLQAAAGHDYLAAGQLLLNKAGRTDLAILYFETGWTFRPEANAISCALHLARLYARQEASAKLLALVAEGEAYLNPPGHEVVAGQFYNEIARLADQPALASVRDELRDRARMGLAVKLRQRVEGEAVSVKVVSTLMGQVRTWKPAQADLFPRQGNPWPTLIVSDADYAVHAALKRIGPSSTGEPTRGTATRLRIGTGVVTAVCQAPISGELFLGFQNGEIVCFRPWSNEVVKCPYGSYPPASLAVDPEGELVAVLYEFGDNSAYLSSLTKYHGMYARAERRQIHGPGPFWLTPLIVKIRGEYLVGLWNGGMLNALRGPLLIPAFRDLVPVAQIDPSAGLVLPAYHHRDADLDAFAFGSDLLLFLTRPARKLHRIRLGWTPQVLQESTLRSASLSWLQRDAEHLELAGLGAHGTMHWSLLLLSDGTLAVVATNTSALGYLAMTIVRSGLVAGVRRSCIDWCRTGSGQFSSWMTTKISLPNAVACFPSHQTDEVLVVCADGWMVRVPVPS